MIAPTRLWRSSALVLILATCGLLAVSPGKGQQAGPPPLPRHYNHIRIAMLAYSGNPMGEFEDGLLRNSVDLVVPNAAFFQHCSDVAPRTPRLFYTNTSNLYQDLLMDWLAFADAKGVSREAAFYHAAAPKAFKGNSPSSQPVAWFWRVLRGSDSLSNYTSQAHSNSAQVPFGNAGQSVYLGFPERFREINVHLVAAGQNFRYVLEYCNRVDPQGAPSAWTQVALQSDSTVGLTESGRLTFDPPAGWQPGVLAGSPRLYYVRLRTTDAARTPVATAILGRDYVKANGTDSGTVPAFDSAADANRDGYLDDTEYARRAPGKDARFVYESRMVTEQYGQMRFGTNPSNAAFRTWAVDYHLRLVARNPLAGGLFMDNSNGKPFVHGGDVVEVTTTFNQDLGALIGGINTAIAPRWILANTCGGMADAHPIVRANPAYFEEFALRPLAHTWQQFEEAVGDIERRARLTTPAPLAVIDTHPQNGSPTDPRMQIATLAAYYMVADPESTMLMFYGGFEPSTTWKRHWTQAAAFDVGRPVNHWSRFTFGTDPANVTLQYRVYARSYDKALVLYRPLSHNPQKTSRASIGDETAVTHQLGATFRPLLADGTLGTAVTTVTLRNGEGAILIRSAK